MLIAWKDALRDISEPVLSTGYDEVTRFGEVITFRDPEIYSAAMLYRAAVSPLSFPPVTCEGSSRWILVLALLTALMAPAPAVAGCASSDVDPDVPMALVLSGGGAKGAYEAGVAAVFVERGLPVRLVAGSSAGALNAAMIADGRMDRLETMWRTVERERVYTLRASVFFAGFLPGWLTLFALNEITSLFDPSPLRELITASLDFDRIRASPVRLLVTATDLAGR